MNRFRNKRYLLFFVAICLSLAGSAQESNRYFIYLKDKGASSNAYSLQNPSDFLTQRSISRREKENLGIDSTDLPVNKEYLTELSEVGADVFFTSKWLNGVLVEAKSTDLTSIQNLKCVDSIRLVANGTRLIKRSNQYVQPTHFDAPGKMDANTDIQLGMLEGDIMHSENNTGQGVLVGVFDNGFRGVNLYSPFQHIWENNQLIGAKDFVENSGDPFQFGSHGTSVFSIIGAVYETDTTNYYGMAHEADFILCVTEDNEGENTIEEYNWIFAAEYADSLGVDVINTSLGYLTFQIPSHDYTSDDLDGETSIISKAAEMAASKGIIVVTSAGNTGNSEEPANLISPPADADSILVVGSVNTDFSYSPFSSVGPTADGRTKPDVAALGSSVAIVKGNGDIGKGGGTSYASPLVAGFAAGILQAHPDWTSQQVIKAIKESGHNANNPDNLVGYGVPSYTLAVNGNSKILAIESATGDEITVYPNPVTGSTLSIKFNRPLGEEIQVQLVDSNGKLILNKMINSPTTSIEVNLAELPSGSALYYLRIKSDQINRVVKIINF